MGIFGFIKKPIEKFIRVEGSSGILLMASAVLAMVLANSAWSDQYFNLLDDKFFSLSISHWINDALMAIFFFVVGLEIKREIVAGELSTRRKAALPVASALGGMVVPAIVYSCFNKGEPTLHGWAIPTATDIAFALGVLALFGSRISLNLKIFLLALAIVDDLGAVLIIAFFYTEEIKMIGLVMAVIAFFLILVLRKKKIKSYFVYFVLGAVAWVGFFYSGVHATIAGVILGLLTPNSFQKKKNSMKELYSPIGELIHTLHPVVSYFIMPLFALANAGLTVNNFKLSSFLDNAVSLGVMFGLVIGKPVGIFLFSWISVLLKLSQLPSQVSWRGVFGISILGGIGFTMSIFIANLALDKSTVIYAKMGVLMGSFVSAFLGIIFILLGMKKANQRT